MGGGYYGLALGPVDGLPAVAAPPSRQTVT